MQLKANSTIFVAYEDSDSLSAVSKCDVFPGAMPPIPAREETEADAGTRASARALDFTHFWAEKSWANAVEAVNGADVIVVSLSGRADLPVPVRRWMESWPHYEQASHTTLVVVFGTESTEDSRQNVLISYFQQIAQSHGLDFLCNCQIFESAKTLPVTPEAPEPVPTVERPRAERFQPFNLLGAPKAA
jgi:hypothetical protein